MEKIMTERLNDDCIDTYANDALELAKKLFPLNRSINSPGTLQTLKELQVSVPQMKIKQFEAGNKVLDWNIPKRWEVRKASIKRLNGETVLDMNDSNLHVIAHSIPIKAKVKFIDLKESIYTLIEKPDAIPYRTSFYKEAWGFCMEHSKFLLMHDDEYLVEIDSIFTNQPMPYGEIFVPGLNEEKEVLFSTYICHPSMANNELSGPSVVTFLAKWLQEIGEPEYSYRIIFIPETIGSITYLSFNYKYMKKKVFAGFNVTCVGDDRAYSYVPSRNGKTISDLIANHVLKWTDINFVKYSWLDRGSDERQYCAPGIDLPIASILRTKYGIYPEYHTSLDDLENVVTPKGLNGGYWAIRKAIEAIEKNKKYKVAVLCEPQMGRRGLYPTLSTKNSDDEVKLMMDFISLCDGENSLLEIAESLKIPIWNLYDIVDKLVDHNLINANE